VTGVENHPVLSACQVLIKLASAIAPGSERRTWNRDWHAELEYLWTRAAPDGHPGARGAMDMLGVSTGAVMHALWLRGQEWRPDMLLQDIRFAFRSLTKRPLFAIVVVLTIALGVGVNAGIFSVMYDVVLAPLPFDDPEELVMVWEHNVSRDNPTNVVAPANFFVWRE